MKMLSFIVLHHRNQEKDAEWDVWDIMNIAYVILTDMRAELIETGMEIDTMSHTTIDIHIQSQGIHIITIIIIQRHFRSHWIYLEGKNERFLFSKQLISWLNWCWLNNYWIKLWFIEFSILYNCKLILFNETFSK